MINLGTSTKTILTKSNRSLISWKQNLNKPNLNSINCKLSNGKTLKT